MKYLYPASPAVSRLLRRPGRHGPLCGGRPHAGNAGRPRFDLRPYGRRYGGASALAELLRNIARASGVNLSVRSVENVPVSCNFTRARVDDLVRFLCREYRLDVETTGNILSVFPAAPVPAPQPDPDVFYNAADTTLFYDLRGERLIDVAKKITTFSGRNIIVPQPLYDYKVSGYVRAMPFDGALHTLASVNGLTAEKDAQEVWTLYREQAAPQRAAPRARRIRGGGSSRRTNCWPTRWGASRRISRGAMCRILSSTSASSWS